MIPPATGQPVRGPDAVLRDEPGEKFAFRRCPCSPDHIEFWHFDTSYELCFVCRSRRVISGPNELPFDLVLLVLLQLNVAKHSQCVRYSWRCVTVSPSALLISRIQFCRCSAATTILFFGR